MKGTLLFILLTYCTTIYGHNLAVTKTDISLTSETQFSKDTLAISSESFSDTINLDLNSNEETIIPIKPDTATRVILVKEKNIIDFINYLMTFLAVLFGISIKWFIDRTSNKNRIKTAGNRWLAELRSTEEPIKIQINNLKIFKSEMDTGEQLISKLFIVSTLNGEIFKSLNKDDLTQYVRSKYKKLDFADIIKITNKIHSYISTLSYLYETLRKELNEYRQSISKSTASLNKNFQSLMLAITDYGVSFELEDEILYEDPRYKPILDLLNTQIAPIWGAEFDPFKLEIDFLNPLVNILGSLRLYDKTRPLLIIINNCLNDIHAIKEKKTYFMEIIKYMSDNYGTQLVNLNSSISDLEK